MELGGWMQFRTVQEERKHVDAQANSATTSCHLTTVGLSFLICQMRTWDAPKSFPQVNALGGVLPKQAQMLCQGGI